MRDTPGRCRSMPPLKFAFPLIRANTLITSFGASVVPRAAPVLHRSPLSEAAPQQDSDSKQGKPIGNIRRAAPVNGRPVVRPEPPDRRHRDNFGEFREVRCRQRPQGPVTNRDQPELVRAGIGMHRDQPLCIVGRPLFRRDPLAFDDEPWGRCVGRFDGQDSEAPPGAALQIRSELATGDEDGAVVRAGGGSDLLRRRVKLPGSSGSAGVKLILAALW